VIVVGLGEPELTEDVLDMLFDRALGQQGAKIYIKQFSTCEP
jgi:hypothetical protein